MNTEIVILAFFCAICLFCKVDADCTVHGKSEEQYKSILDPIKGKKIVVSDTGANYSYQYDIGVCVGVTDTTDVGALQTDLKSSGTTKRLGLITKAHIQAGTDWVLLTYREGDQYGTHCHNENRKAVIMFVCDPYNLIGSATIIAENRDKTSECYYLFEVGSSAVCNSSGSGGLSVGSILCIIFFVLVILYILGGTLYQRCVLGAKGMEQFPNITFWREFGNLIADGADLVFRTTPKGQPKTYKGIGDDQLDMDDDDDRDDHLLPM